MAKQNISNVSSNFLDIFYLNFCMTYLVHRSHVFFRVLKYAIIKV